jgi:hypothetical protein
MTFQADDRSSGGLTLHVVDADLKEVDPSEATLRFWQEIYDDKGRLAEIHEKYPLDKGHRKA